MVQKSLFEDVRTEQNLFSAWRHVKRSALSSVNGAIRGQAAEFEHSHQTHLHRIATQIRENRFSFDPVVGVLKDKKPRLAAGKDPRPIAVSSIQNRVVQRAILQVFQPRKICSTSDINSRYTALEDPRLRRINDVNKSLYGVGGLLKPYGGVRPAIERITKAIDAGACYFYQSDIKAFFTQIPTQIVLDIILQETGDEKLCALFSQGLKVDLENKEELCTYARLFPAGGIGVAQGSSLSAFTGNVLLYGLDHELNSDRVTAVRYIDDVLMVSSDESALDSAVDLARNRLGDFGFDLYSPESNSDKAARGKCSSSINFLGCTVQPRRVVPSKKSIDKISQDVSTSISKSKAAIKTSLASGQTLNSKHSQSAVLQKIGKQVFGWQRSFAFCTEAFPFAQLDRNIEKKVSDYANWIYRSTKSTDEKTKLAILGVPSTEELFHEFNSA